MFARFVSSIQTWWYGSPDALSEEKQPLLLDSERTSYVFSRYNEENQRIEINDEVESSYCTQVIIKFCSANADATSKQLAVASPYSVYKCAYLGIGRDFFWALATYNNWDFVSQILKATGASADILNNKYLQNFIGPWTTQLVMGGAGLALSTCSLFDNREYRNVHGKKVLLTYALASLLSLIPWNMALYGGFQLGKRLGMTDTEANAFDAIFTAVVEGFIQYYVITTGTHYLKKQSGEDQSEENTKLSHRLLDLLAVIPSGGVWQLVYVALLGIAAESLGMSMLASAGVGLAVATTTIVMDKAVGKLKDLLDHCCVEIEDESKHKHHAHMDLYGGMI